MRKQRVVIYADEGASQWSVNGCTEMLTNSIVQRQIGSYLDVSTLQGHSLEGLNNAVFVIPGGNAAEMLSTTSRMFTPKIVNDRGNFFLAICAGAIICCQKWVIPITQEGERCTTAELPSSELTEITFSQEEMDSLATVPVTAIAPCYPEKKPLEDVNNDVISVEVTSRIEEIKRKSKQYFIRGPHFETSMTENPNMRTVATYSSTAAPAVIHFGNKVIFGIHPEAPWGQPVPTVFPTLSEIFSSLDHSTKLVG